MKIQLIHPPMDKQYTGKSSTVVQSAPVGLEIIAKTTELRTPDSEITIVDGLRTPLEQILTDIDHDIVGVDDWYSSHRNALTILQTAKQRGATTVIGGPNTTHLAERILTNNPFIDYAFVGDAEHSFSMLVEDLPLEQIPGLVYRENSEK